jgi:thiol-disulfide isomerase/thioredoxin
MRHLLAGLLGLAVLAPVWADDKAAETPKTPAEKFDALQKACDKEMAKFGEEHMKAKTAEQRAKIEEQALKVVAGQYAKKMMAIADESPKDPVAIKALMWVCINGYRTDLAPDALARLLKDHPEIQQLALVCRYLQRRPDGETLIRDVRTKTTDKVVKIQAGIFLAGMIRDKNDPVSAEKAEKLLEEVVAEAKQAGTDVPARTVAQAEDDLKDVRVFGAGKPAPAAEAKDLDDKNVALADLKGKVVVLDFWATWCGPCKSMIPHERDMVKKLAGKPFAFVSVSADDKVETVKEFVDKEPMPWTHWFAGKSGEVLKNWNIHAFPTIYVIDGKGVIRGKFIGAGSDTEKKLEALVEKLVSESDGKGVE